MGEACRGCSATWPVCRKRPLTLVAGSPVCSHGFSSLPTLLCAGTGSRSKGASPSGAAASDTAGPCSPVPWGPQLKRPPLGSAPCSCLLQGQALGSTCGASP